MKKANEETVKMNTVAISQNKMLIVDDSKKEAFFEANKKNKAIVKLLERAKKLDRNRIKG